MKHLKLFFMIVTGALMLSFLSACVSPVKWNEDGKSCEYQGYKYISILNNEWKISPSPSQVKKIGICYGEAYSIDTVFVTCEDIPNLVMIDYDKTKTDINPGFCLPYIREDIELTSVFDTVFESVSVEYADSVSRDERLFDNVSGGITLKDMITKNAEGVSISKEREYYCQLSCTYPGINYLKCKFDVVIFEGEYYIRTEYTPDGEYATTYYLLDIEKIKEYKLPLKKTKK